MAIDPRRSRRGTAGRFGRWKILTLAAFAAAGPAANERAHAQLVLPTLPDVGPGTYGTPWRFGASLGIDETWSDNINLSPAGQERSDFVTSLNPTFTANRSGPRLNAHLDYSPQYLYYANGTNGTNLRNSLDASVNAIVIQNLLFVDASSAISQQNISPFGTQAANSVNGSTNRAEARSYTFAPRLQSRFEQDVTYTLGARYNFSNADSSAFASNHTSEYYGSLQTGTSFRDVGGGVNFDRSEQVFNGSNSIVVESASANVQYVVAPTVHAHASIGYDRNSYPTTRQADLAGTSYSAGLDWQPTHHTSLDATLGHRYFGPTANIRLQESRTRWVLSAGYTRDQTTSTGNGLTQVADPTYALIDQLYATTITDPVLRAQQVTSFLTAAGLPTSRYSSSSFISNQIYVQKQLYASLALIGLANTVTFNAQRTESQGLSNVTVGFDIFDQASRFRTTSYGANWSHRLGPRTNLNAGITRSSSRALEGSGDTRQRYFFVSASRQISRLLSGTILYRNTVQTGSGTNNLFANGNNGNGNDNNFFSGSYRENAVLGSLRVNF